MASRMKYSAAIMPLMRKNGRKGLKCLKHCLIETHMKHGGVKNKPQRLCQHVLFRSCRAMGLFKWRETLRVEALSEM